MAMVREGVGTGDGPTSSPVRLGLGKGIKDLQPITQLWIPFFPDPLHSGEAEGWGVEACCHRMVGGEGAAVICMGTHRTRASFGGQGLPLCLPGADHGQITTSPQTLTRQCPEGAE